MYIFVIDAPVYQYLQENRPDSRVSRVFQDAKTPFRIACFHILPIKTMSQSSKKAKEIKALPISETLRDLALLRAGDVDLADLVPAEAEAEDGDDKGTEAVKDSTEFIAEGRKALKLHDHGEIEIQGKKVDDVRRKYEDLLEALS